jgi:phosphotransferase system enzyme I (PtsP)
MPKLCANISTLYPEMSFLQRFSAAAEDGFDAVEFQFAYEYTSAELVAAAKSASVKVVLLNCPAGDLEAVLDIIVERVKDAMNTEVCSIYLHDEHDERFVFMATRGLNTDAVGKVSLALDEGLVGYVAERAEPINLEDAKNHPRNRFFEEVGEESFHAFLGVPIIHHRKVLGVLVVQQTQTRRFDESEEAFLITLSAQLAGVIAHAKATGSLMLTDAGKKKDSTRFLGMSGA